VDWKRFHEPSFVAAALGCILLLFLLASRPGTPALSEVVDLRTQLQELHTTAKSIESRLDGLKANMTHSSGLEFPASWNVPSQLKEFERALSISQTLLNKGDFALASDMIMVASRLAPSDPRLFDLFVQFIEKARLSDDEDVIAIGEDLLERGDSLVHFQSPGNVESSRKRITDLRQHSSDQTTQSNPIDSLEPVRNLLAVADNSAVALPIRSRAVEQARSALSDAQLSQVLTGIGIGERVESNELEELDRRIATAESQCVKELYLQSKSRVDLWLTTSSSVMSEIEKTPSEKVPELSQKIADLLTQGFEHLQELMPYSKSGIEGSPEFTDAVEKQVKILQRQKTWLYNQQTLRLVREMESKKEWTAEDKIRHLAEVSEELLSPYVLRRHNELWDKVFESLPDEDKKVWAVRLRILRLNE